MADSVYEDCVERSKTLIEDLGLTMADDTVINVDIGKLPTAKETIDSLPLIRLYMSNLVVKDKPWGTQGVDGVPLKYREYMMGIVFISRCLKDRRKSLPDVLKIRQAMARAFGGTRPVAVPELHTTKFYPDLPFNPRAYNMSYDYSVMAVRFCCVEPAYE